MSKSLKTIEIYRLKGESIIVDRTLELKVTGVTSRGAYLELTTTEATEVEAKPKQSLLQILWRLLFKRRKR